MPGIVGVVDLSGRANIGRVISESCELLNRKGTYKVSKHSFGSNLAIARVHLDIFNPGVQPFCDDTGKVFVFLEGEIYLPETVGNVTGNSQLSHICALYKAKGIEFASLLNGSFVVVIYDSERNLLIISADRAASRPVYYSKTTNAFYFSPEIKAMMQNWDINNRLDDIALASFLTNGYPISDSTFFKGIKILKPGASIMVDTETLSVNHCTYWEYVFDEGIIDRGEDYYIEELSCLVKRAVERQISDGYRMALLLSGGVDSRGILGYCLMKLQEIAAVTWGETSDKKNSDAAIARQICRDLNVKHRFYKLDPSRLVDCAREWVYETEAMADFMGNTPQGPEIFEELRKDFDVILRGDHSFGYDRTARDEVETMSPCHYVANSLDSRLEKVLDADSHRRFKDQYEEEVKKISAQCELQDADNRKDYYRYYVNIFRNHPAMTYYKLRYVEQRCPLMDNDILDFTLRLPPKYRINRQLWIKTVAHTFPELMGRSRATKDNLPDWPRQFRRNKRLQDFVINTLTVNGRDDDGFFQLFDRQRLRVFIESYLTSEPFTTKLKDKLYSLVRSSGFWSSKLGRPLKRLLLQRVLIERRKFEVPMDVFIMRLIILKLWFDQFWPNLERKQ
jgi:asparagine synthase (glutamine-hydrolysing)